MNSEKYELEYEPANQSSKLDVAFEIPAFMMSAEKESRLRGEASYSILMEDH